MDIDRLGITIIAQEPDDPLRLAQRISPDEMGTFGKLFDGGEQFGRFHTRQRMVKYWQAEGGFGDEDIAGHRLEGAQVGSMPRL